MKNLRLNALIFLVWMVLAIVMIFIYTLLMNSNIISPNKTDVYGFITFLVLAFLLGFLSGNIKTKSGLVNGILFSTFIVLAFIIINFFTKTISLQFSHIVKYIILILTSGLGGIIGVNFKPLIK